MDHTKQMRSGDIPEFGILIKTAEDVFDSYTKGIPADSFPIVEHRYKLVEKWPMGLQMVAIYRYMKD